MNRLCMMCMYDTIDTSEEIHRSGSSSDLEAVHPLRKSIGNRHQNSIEYLFGDIFFSILAFTFNFPIHIEFNES